MILCMALKTKSSQKEFNKRSKAMIEVLTVCMTDMRSELVGSEIWLTSMTPSVLANQNKKTMTRMIWKNVK